MRPFLQKGCGILANKKRLKLSTPSEVRRALARIANMVLNGELAAKEANTVIYACNVLLGALRTDEQERRLDELEALLNDLEQNK